MLRKIDDLIYLVVQPVHEWIEYFTGMKHTTQAKFLTLVVCCMFFIHVWGQQFETIKLSMLTLYMAGIIYTIFTLASIVKPEHTLGVVNIFRDYTVAVYARLASVTFFVLIYVFSSEIYLQILTFGITVSLYLLGCQSLPPGKKRKVLQKVHV